MQWIVLKEASQLDEILKESKNSPVLIYKHSTRCNISRTALDRLERSWDAAEADLIKPYFLDLISYRALSDRIANVFEVEHHSPQILVIADGRSVLDLSHFEIEFDRILQAIKN